MLLLVAFAYADSDCVEEIVAITISHVFCVLEFQQTYRRRLAGGSAMAEDDEMDRL